MRILNEIEIFAVARSETRHSNCYSSLINEPLSQDDANKDEIVLCSREMDELKSH